MAQTVNLYRLGLTPYKNFLGIQSSLIERCKSHGQQSLLILQHPPVYTAGRRSTGFSAFNGHLPGEVYDIRRGGQVTFHGPGQIVCYPVFDLQKFKPNLRWYVGCLESVLLETCQRVGLNNVSCKDSIGVWVDGTRKIGFIGFQNSKWITSHGISLNVNVDLSFFNNITPCGDPGIKVTSISKELNSLISLEKVENVMIQVFSNIFNCEFIQSSGTGMVEHNDPRLFHASPCPHQEVFHPFGDIRWVKIISAFTVT